MKSRVEYTCWLLRSSENGAVDRRQEGDKKTLVQQTLDFQRSSMAINLNFFTVVTETMDIYE